LIGTLHSPIYEEACRVNYKFEEISEKYKEVRRARRAYQNSTLPSPGVEKQFQPQNISIPQYSQGQFHNFHHALLHAMLTPHIPLLSKPFNLQYQNGQLPNFPQAPLQAMPTQYTTLSSQPSYPGYPNRQPTNTLKIKPPYQPRQHNPAQDSSFTPTNLPPLPEASQGATTALPEQNPQAKKSIHKQKLGLTKAVIQQPLSLSQLSNIPVLPQQAPVNYIAP
jgi:hypothetical protein